MNKSSIASEKTQEQPEPVVEQPAPPPSAAYVESVRITPTLLWNAVLEKSHQGGSKGGRSE